MHILKDENGNIIPHGSGDHDHEHGCAHSHDGSGHAGHDEHASKDETLALLGYMVNHNAHHAAEADEMADSLEKRGMADVAEKIREGVAEYQKGNTYLSVALSLYKDHLKEQDQK